MIVIVVVIMAVERQRAAGPGAKERAVFRGRGHNGGRAFATDMPVEADHPVRCAHHHVQLVADHQDGAAGFFPYLFDLSIEGGRTRLIQPLGGFIEQ